MEGEEGIEGKGDGAFESIAFSIVVVDDNLLGLGVEVAEDCVGVKLTNGTIGMDGHGFIAACIVQADAALEGLGAGANSAGNDGGFGLVVFEVDELSGF